MNIRREAISAHVRVRDEAERLDAPGPLRCPVCDHCPDDASREHARDLMTAMLVGGTAVAGIVALIAFVCWMMP